MRKKILTSVILLTLVLTGSSFISDWTLFQRDNYKILFPGTPMNDTGSVDSEIGTLTIYNHLYESPEGASDSNLVYGLSVSDYPPQYFTSTDKAFLKEFFDGAVEGAVKNVQGKLLSEKEITFKDYPGREIKVEYGGGIAVITMKVILVKSRVYALQTIALSGKDKNSNAARFYRSFDIK